MTVAKENCWSNYEVNITVVDLDTRKDVTHFSIPKGKPWVRQAFSCQPHQKLMYYATFKPEIWRDDAGKSYRAQRFWGLPTLINPAEKAWELKVCYASDFAETPLPPESGGHCQCDFSGIPAVGA